MLAGTAAAMLALVLLRLMAHRALPPSPPVQAPAVPQRIVSLAPSITETLFALGLGRRVVGVTRYCDYPPEALKIQRVGGYLDVNYESILSLRPDLVILIREHTEAAGRLADLGIATLAVDHSRVDGILASITLMAERCGAGEKGRDLLVSLEERLRSIQGRAEARVGPSPPRVLVAVGRNLQSDSAGEVYVSGRDGYYDDLLRLAGARNAYDDETLKLPALSAEGVVRLDPDVILEMLPDLPPDRDVEGLLGYWSSVPGLRAVREGRVFILGGDHVVVPGPRFADLLDEMVTLIHGTGTAPQGRP